MIVRKVLVEPDTNLPFLIEAYIVIIDSKWPNTMEELIKANESLAEHIQSLSIV